MAERLEQLRHHQTAEDVRQTAVEAATAPECEKSGKQLKRDANALQATFLSGNLGRIVTVATINNFRLTGRLKRFDQYCLLLEGQDGICSLVFKHCLSTVQLSKN